jgi:hypothetical protein
MAPTFLLIALDNVETEATPLPAIVSNLQSTESRKVKNEPTRQPVGEAAWATTTISWRALSFQGRRRHRCDLPSAEFVFLQFM